MLSHAFRYIFLKQSRGYHKFYESQFKCQNTQTVVFSIVFVVSAIYGSDVLSCLLHSQVCLWIVYFCQIKKTMFQDILYLDMDPTRLSIKITYFSLFFKFLSDIIGLNKQHRSQGFHSIL